MCCKFEEAGLNMVGINTDCLYFREKVSDFVDQHPKPFGDGSTYKGIGLWNHGAGKQPINKMMRVQQNELALEEMPDPVVNEVKVDGEQDWETSKEWLNGCLDVMGKQNTLLLAKYPGCGKTYLVEQYVKGKKYMIVVPYNTLRYDLMKKGYDNVQTLASLMGLGVDGQKRGSAVNLEGIDIIAFDEIYLYNVGDRWRIYTLMQQHPNIRFVATGDYRQNEAVCLGVDDEMNVKMINYLFSNHLVLNEVKRVDDERDKKLYPLLYDALFEQKMHPKLVVEKYFADRITTKKADIKHELNITLTNATRQAVNQIVHKRKRRKSIHTEGQTLILKTYIRGMINNGEYRLVNLGEKNFTVRNTEGSKTLRINKLKHFQLPYGRTCQSYQGLTIRSPFTIFDIDHYFCDAKWFWTAITRASSLKYVHFFLGKSLGEHLKRSEHIQKKLKGYKKTDKEKGLFDSDHFIDKKWIRDALEKTKRCPRTRCGNAWLPDGKNQWSVNRISNSLGHVKSNCEIICYSCNCSLH